MIVTRFLVWVMMMASTPKLVRAQSPECLSETAALTASDSNLRFTRSEVFRQLSRSGRECTYRDIGNDVSVPEACEYDFGVFSTTDDYESACMAAGGVIYTEDVILDCQFTFRGENYAVVESFDRYPTCVAAVCGTLSGVPATSIAELEAALFKEAAYDSCMYRNAAAGNPPPAGAPPTLAPAGSPSEATNTGCDGDPNASAGLQSASRGMENSQLGLDEDGICITDTTTLVTTCTYNYVYLGTVSDQVDAYNAACSSAGGIPTTQEFTIFCQDNSPGSLSLLGNFVSMPACSSCCAEIADTPLVAYASSFDVSFRSIMGVGCTTQLRRTNAPQDGTCEPGGSGSSSASALHFKMSLLSLALFHGILLLLW